jgi:type I restriction enzyme S subunit
MTNQQFLQQFGHFIEAPNGIQKLRELILQLAVQGKLVPQDPNDEPASALLEMTVSEKNKLINDKVIRKTKAPALPDEEPPHQLPSSWAWTNLYEMGEIGPRNEADDDMDSSFVPMQLISDNYGTPVQHEVKLWKEIKSGFTHFREEDVVLAKITPCFQNGKSAVMRGLTNGFGAGTTELHVYRAINSCTVPEYVLAYLKSPAFILGGIPKMTGTAGQKRITRDYFAGNHFPLPPLPEQHRIVAKVDELMALCDRLEIEHNAREATHQRLIRAVHHPLTEATDTTTGIDSLTAAWRRIRDNFAELYTTLESVQVLRQTILQLAVQGKLVPQDPSDEPASLLIERMSKNRDELLQGCQSENKECVTMLRKLGKLSIPEPPFKLPGTWECIHLIQASLMLVDCHNKTAPYVSCGIPIIRTSNIRDREFRMVDVKYVNQETYDYWSRRCPPEPGDIIFTREAPMGEAAIIPAGGTYCLGQRTMLIRPMSEFISASYLLLTLTEPHLLERASEHAIGSTVKHLRVGDVENLNIPIPPLAEQHRIVAKVDEMMALCDQLEANVRAKSDTASRYAEAIVQQIAAA